MEALIRKHPGARLLKIDIKTWGSPVSQQFKVKSIPHILHFDTNKRARGKVSVQQVSQLLAK